MSIAFSIFVIAVISALYLLIRPIMRGAVYFPTKQVAIEAMIRLADPKPGERLIDLGSGDGRIVIAFAKAGIESHGYEINPLLVLQSRLAIRKAGVQTKAFVHWESFWRINFGSYDIVSVYGIPYIMKPLSEKLSREMKPGSRIVSNMYSFPGWQEQEKEKSVYLYIAPPPRSGHA